MVKNKNKNKKDVGLGTSFEKCFVTSNTKLLVVAFLYDDDNKVSIRSSGVLLEAGRVFLMTS